MGQCEKRWSATAGRYEVARERDGDGERENTSKLRLVSRGSRRSESKRLGDGERNVEERVRKRIMGGRGTGTL